MTPIEKAAYDIGAKGSEPREDERLAFEAWMRGHCWKVEGDWDGKQYKHDCEDGEFVHGGAMNTRGLWAAWRDRGAVARVLAEQAQAVEPVAWLVLDEDKVPIMCAPTKQMCNDQINDAINDFDITEASKWVVRKVFTHPAPPQAGDHVPEAAFGNTERAELIAALIRKAEVWELWIPEAKRPNVCRETADMLEADAREIEATEKQVEILSDELSKCSKAQQVAVPVPLTDDEIMQLGRLAADQEIDISKPTWEQFSLHLTRAIEAHHGITAKPPHTDWSAA